MKKLFFLLMAVVCLPLAAETLPDNIYFNAMKDEMVRTQKELRVSGAAKPYFTAYKLFKNTKMTLKSNFGQPANWRMEPQTALSAQVYMYAGDKKHNNAGFTDEEAWYYRPISTGNIADSYEGIRRALWMATDGAYVQAASLYEKKMAYKRQKNLMDGTPDFTKAPKAVFVEKTEAFPVVDASAVQAVLDEVAALGKTLPQAESFSVTWESAVRTVYFLDSEGDFAQYSMPSSGVLLQVRLRSRSGYQVALQDTVRGEAVENLDKQVLLAKAEALLKSARQAYEAKNAEAYLGPVLLKPRAAAGFFNELFVKNARYSKPLLSAQWETDGSVGQFKDKLGMRVLSHLFHVYDRPTLREFASKPLTAFMPMDDEGVLAKDLQLVQAGKLLALPTVRNPISGQKQSNGRARMSGYILPRAMLSNVFFEPRETLTEKDLEEKLLARCRELELEYCYLFDHFPTLSRGNGELRFAERIYTADGRKEIVHGLRLSGVTVRSLRDILAAGDKPEAFGFADNGLSVSVVSPAVVVDEIEILPTQRKPDRKPFISLP